MGLTKKHTKREESRGIEGGGLERVRRGGRGRYKNGRRNGERREREIDMARIEIERAIEEGLGRETERKRQR